MIIMFIRGLNFQDWSTNPTHWTVLMENHRYLMTPYPSDLTEQVLRPELRKWLKDFLLTNLILSGQFDLDISSSGVGPNMFSTFGS